MAERARRRRLLLLPPLAILLLALLLRLPGLDRWPPAIHQDEASNGVDGWSLLTTGADRAGRVWPVFLEGFGAGDNRTSLYAMLTIPAVALLGPGTVATRLPAALIGSWTALAAFLFLRRIRGTAAGAWAGVLLATNPWHIYLSRFGQEASLTPAFLVTALWLVSRGGAAAAPATPATRARWAAAGLTLAAGLYSYASFRIFLPLLLAAAWIARAGPPRDRRAWLVLAGLLAGAAPLAVASLVHPDRLLARGVSASVVGNVHPLGVALEVIALQYAAHFLPGFLFVHGDLNLLHSPGGMGELLWPEILTLPLGLIVALRRRDRWDRLFLIWILLYPIASATTLGDRPQDVPHSLRAAVGLPVFQLLGASGLAAAFGSSYARLRPLATRAAAAAFACALAVDLALFAAAFTGPYAARVAPLYHAAYPPAMRLLAAHRDRFAAAAITATDNPQAYVYAILYGVQTPRDYQRAQKTVTQTETYHLVHRAGDLFYVHTPQDLDADRRALHGRIWAVVAPGQIRSGRLIAAFPYAGGAPGLEVREVDLPPAEEPQRR